MKVVSSLNKSLIEVRAQAEQALEAGDPEALESFANETGFSAQEFKLRLEGGGEAWLGERINARPVAAPEPIGVKELWAKLEALKLDLATLAEYSMVQRTAQGLVGAISSFEDALESMDKTAVSLGTVIEVLKTTVKPDSIEVSFDAGSERVGSVSCVQSLPSGEVEFSARFVKEGQGVELQSPGLSVNGVCVRASDDDFIELDEADVSKAAMNAIDWTSLVREAINGKSLDDTPTLG